jgi:hypothetical protein
MLEKLIINFRFRKINYKLQFMIFWALREERFSKTPTYIFIPSLSKMWVRSLYVKRQWNYFFYIRNREANNWWIRAVVIPEMQNSFMVWYFQFFQQLCIWKHYVMMCRWWRHTLGSRTTTPDRRVSPTTTWRPPPQPRDTHPPPHPAHKPL